MTRKNSTWQPKNDDGTYNEIPESAKNGFDYLRNYLLTATTLFNPKTDRPCYLVTDASKGTKEIGGMIGWVVVQESDTPGQ